MNRFTLCNVDLAVFWTCKPNWWSLDFKCQIVSGTNCRNVLSVQSTGTRTALEYQLNCQPLVILGWNNKYWISCLSFCSWKYEEFRHHDCFVPFPDIKVNESKTKQRHGCGPVLSDSLQMSGRLNYGQPMHSLCICIGYFLFNLNRKVCQYPVNAL